MISDRDLALLCAKTYDPRVTWTFAGPTFHAILVETPDGPVIAIEGSKSIPDWFKDFDLIGHASFDHPELGPVHAGFNATSDECLDLIIAAVIGRDPIITGHSKGGVEGEMVSAKLAAKGIKTAKLSTFGTPKWVFPGNKKVAPLLPASLIGTSYRHFKDIVPEEPEIYLHPVTRPIVEIGTGTLLERLDPAGMHHIDGYIASMPV
jgi:hypothetical protein